MYQFLLLFCFYFSEHLHFANQHINFQNAPDMLLKLINENIIPFFPEILSFCQAFITGKAVSLTPFSLDKE